MHALAARGLRLRGLTSDTALAAYLALPGQRSFDLADLALRYTRRELRGDAAASGQLTLDMAGETRGGGGARRSARWPPPSWPTRSTPTWPGGAPPSCSPRSSCRW